MIACAIAALCMLVDDLPESQYNTFHDPGTAAMLSIVFADAFSLAVRGGWRKLAFVAFVPALLLKWFLQPFFWVENAWFWVIGTLLLIHALLGFLAARGTTLRIKLICCVAGLTGVVMALFTLCLIRLAGTSWIHFYVQLAAARLLIPSAFWTAVLLVESRLMTPNTGAGSEVEGI